MAKRLIYVSHWRFPSEKTMTPLILKTCEGFKKEGFEVELWVPRRRNESAGDPFAGSGITERFPIRTIWALDWMHIFGRAGFLFMIATFNLGVFLRLRRERGSVLYGHDLRDFILPCLSGLPLYIEIHDFYESSLRTVNAFVLKRSTGLIVTNRLKMERLTKRYGYPKERMLWQPNAVNVEQFSPRPQATARAELGLADTQTVVLYTGHLFAWKGVYTLAEASAHLPDTVSIYFVGGTEHDRRELQRFVRERNLPRILFIEHQAHERMPVWQAAADVLVLPNTAKDEASRLETSPVKLFEYLCSGRPVVASDLPSIKEVVSDREVFFFEPDSPLSLAKVIEHVTHDTAEVKGRVSAAQSLAQTHSWSRRARAISQFLTETGQ